MKKDIDAVKNILDTIESLNVEPMALLAILYKSFRNVIDIQLNKNATAESTGMSSKQFFAVKFNVGKFSSERLIANFDTLVSIDLRLKNGLLEHEKIIDYLLINLLV